MPDLGGQLLIEQHDVVTRLLTQGGEVAGLHQRPGLVVPAAARQAVERGVCEEGEPTVLEGAELDLRGLARDGRTARQVQHRRNLPASIWLVGHVFPQGVAAHAAPKS